MFNKENLQHISFLQIFLAFFLILLPLLQIDIARNISSLPKSILIEACSLVFLGYYFLQKKYTHLTWHPSILFAVMFVAWALLSNSWSIDPASTKNLSFLFASYLIVFFFLIQFSSNKGIVNTFIFSSVIGGTIVSLIGIVQAYGYNPFQLVQKAAPASTFVNRNFSAQYLDAITPLALISICLVNTIKLKWLYANFLALIFSYHILTLSRGSWSALILGLILLFGISLFDKTIHKTLKSIFIEHKIYYISTFFLSSIIIIYPLLHQASILTTKLDPLSDTSIEIRLTTYFNALQMILDGPITGIGFGAFMLGFRPYMFAFKPLSAANEYRYLTNLHDDPLQILIELGLPGLIFIAIFYFWLLRLSLNLLRNETKTIASIGTGLFLALIFMGLHSLVSFPFYKPVSGLMFWSLAGITIGLNAKPLRLSLTTNLNRIFKFSGLIFTFLLSSILLLQSIHTYLNSFYIKRMSQYYMEQNCKDALRIAEITDFRTTHNTFLIYPIIYSYCEKNLDKLYKKFTEMIQYDNDHALARIVRGNALVKMRQYPQAKKDFLVAAKIVPHRPGPYIGLARIAMLQHQSDIARQLFEAAKKRDPHNKQINTLTKSIETIR